MHGRQGRWTPVVVAGGYLLLTLVLLWPAAPHFTTHLIGDGGDTYQFAWNLWWTRHALVDLHTTPFLTQALHHPGGVSLWLHTLSPWNGLLSIPLQAVFSLEVTYNLIVVLSFVLSGLGAFYLARHLTGGTAGPFVAGLVYTFSSYHFAHALGHLNLVACQWLPFVALYALRTLEVGGWRNGAMCGLAFACNALCESYYTVYALLLLPMLLALRWRRPTRPVLVGAATAVATALAGCGWFVAGMLRAARAEDFVGAHPPDVFSADLLGYVVPNRISSWGRLTESLWSRWTGNATENACFLGFAVIALVVVAVWKVRASRPFAAMAAFFLLLSLGQHLHVGGERTRIPLFYLVLERHVPFFDVMGVPARFDVMVELCVSVMVAFALRRLAWRPAAIAAVAALILVERLAVPYPLVRPEVPRFYRELAHDTRDVALLDLADSDTLPMYLATIHGKPIVAGMVARLPRSALRFIEETPGLPGLLRGHVAPSPLQARELCRRLRIAYVVTHDAARRALVEDGLRLPLVDDRDGIAVFACGP